MARFLAPAHLPDYQFLLDAAGNPAPADLCALLGVSPATERAYRARNAAPRSHGLALWWEGRLGRDAMDCDVVNEARILYGLADAYYRENERLLKLVARLDALAVYGCANSPLAAPPSLPSMPQRSCFRSLRVG